MAHVHVLQPTPCRESQRSTPTPLRQPIGTHSTPERPRFARQPGTSPSRFRIPFIEDGATYAKKVVVPVTRNLRPKAGPGPACPIAHFPAKQIQTAGVTAENRWQYTAGYGELVIGWSYLSRNRDEVATL